MPERNRVIPTGDIVAVPLRGVWLGSRGILHEGHEIVRQHASPAWITCVLEFRGWVAPKWEPRRWTALFFHDEAVALAAGHRPCALCRRDAYTAYQRAVRVATGREPLRAPELDRRLHAERLVARSPGRAAAHVPRRRTHLMPWTGLPSGVFVVAPGGPALVVGDAVIAWTTQGYGTRSARPTRGDAEVLTPPTSVTAIGHGYRPQIDSAATREVFAPQSLRPPDATRTLSRVRVRSGSDQGVTHLTGSAAWSIVGVMTTTPTPTPTSLPSSPQRPALDRFFGTLRRSPLVRSQDRVIAGVCSGIAQRFGISTAVIRVVAVIAALLGPAIVLYLVAWLLLPDAEGGIRLEKALRRGDVPSVALLVVAGLALIPDAGLRPHRAFLEFHRAKVFKDRAA